MDVSTYADKNGYERTRTFDTETVLGVAYERRVSAACAWIKRIPSAPRPIYSDRGSFFELRAASMTQSAMTASQAAQNSHTLL